MNIPESKGSQLIIDELGAMAAANNLKTSFIGDGHENRAMHFAGGRMLADISLSDEFTVIFSMHAYINNDSVFLDVSVVDPFRFSDSYN